MYDDDDEEEEEEEEENKRQTPCDYNRINKTNDAITRPMNISSPK